MKKIVKKVELKMKCDICGIQQNAVLILRKERFAYPNDKVAKDVSRVCFSCARKILREGIYDFGSYWRMIFHYNEVRR